MFLAKCAKKCLFFAQNYDWISCCMDRLLQMNRYEIWQSKCCNRWLRPSFTHVQVSASLVTTKYSRHSVDWACTICGTMWFQTLVVMNVIRAYFESKVGACTWIVEYDSWTLQTSPCNCPPPTCWCLSCKCPWHGRLLRAIWHMSGRQLASH